MQIKRLKLKNVRVFEDIEFDFQSGMNLLVGINGAGKSTVLDVLRIMFSKQIHNFSAARASREYFDENYIRSGQDNLSIELEFTLSGVPFHHVIERESGSEKSDGLLSPTLNAGVKRLMGENPENPLFIYFATNRSLPDFKKPKASIVKNAQATAYVDALKTRPLRLREFAQWWSVLDTLKDERPQNQHILRVLNDAVTTFLKGYSNLKATRNSQSLLIEKDGYYLDVKHLSDGERSVLALVLDIAKRLALANPQSEDPLQQGKAVILIDEIGIHLHPSWERKIVERLTETFKQCQFIATTHSPQIIGEVPADQILLIKDSGVEHPDQSLGMDSGWILKHLMDVSELNIKISQQLDEIERLIEKSKFDQAKAVIRELKPQISDSPELARLQTRIDVLEMLGGNKEG